MYVNKKMGLGDGLTGRGTSIRELTDEELVFVAGGEDGGGDGGSGEGDQGPTGGSGEP